MAKPSVHPLHQLARLYGMQTAYYDVESRCRQASPEALLLVLQALGAPVETFHDVHGALRERRQALWERSVEPVAIAWDGDPLSMTLRLPSGAADATIPCLLEVETGAARRWSCDLQAQSPDHVAEVEGTRYVVKGLTLPGNIPWGYHRLTLEIQGRLFESMIIAAPRKAYGGRGEDKTWGAFLPLYALHSQDSWGGGDFSDLGAFMEWVANQGGGVVATLPLLASFLDEPYDPSPYTPASRLFWNEFYIDVTRVPDLEKCPAAQSLLGSGDTRKELEGLRSAALVDYRRQMGVKRKVLEAMARSFFSEPIDRHPSFRRFVETHGPVEDYACFRAVGDRQGTPWPAWPHPLREGVLRPADYDEEARGYYLYTQWLAHEQICALANRARNGTPGLYLDFPLGVHPYGYDVWRERELFASGIAVGAPPDTFFTEGQTWDFPPLHPEQSRAQHYRYVIASLDHHLRAAGILRIDHVMGLHRLFWIPRGMGPAEGVYVRYPAEELYAIVSLASHRHKAWIIGENLGTVPYYVNPTMARHNIHRMYVLQYELTADRSRPLRAIHADSVASLNTHDMPPFAAFWQGLDIEDREAMGLLDEVGVRRERKRRESIKRALVGFLKRQGHLRGPATMQAVLRACLAHLSASPARVVLVNVEDLWQETEAQNVPGTGEERPNWRRKAAYGLE
ncbi:MAG: 4-alpha-glucanotransferase, partial [Nitrospinota bacterium]